AMIEDEHRPAGARQDQRGAEPGGPAAGDDDVGVVRHRHTLAYRSMPSQLARNASCSAVGVPPVASMGTSSTCGLARTVISRVDSRPSRVRETTVNVEPGVMAATAAMRSVVGVAPLRLTIT